MNYVSELEKRGITVEYGAGDNEALFCCPFHDDSRPSAEINTKRGVFYCFGCKESGSFAKLIAQIDGVPIEKVKKLLMEDDTVASVLSEIEDAFDEYADLDNEIKMFSLKSFHKVFPRVIGTAGEEYLLKRKIDLDTMKRMDLRWGLTGVWEDRVMIPIFTSLGKLLTFAGRTIHKGIQPKTRKARSGLTTLYGLSTILQYAKITTPRVPYLIITEGEFDAMYVQQNRFYAVSTMGTAKLTEDQVMLLKRHASAVIWSYDGDNAGRRAQKEGVAMTKRYNIRTLEVTLPEGKDPNELQQEDLEQIYGKAIRSLA